LLSKRKVKDSFSEYNNTNLSLKSLNSVRGNNKVD